MDGRRCARAMWDLRWAASFMVAPMLGLALVASMFGLPPALKILASAAGLLDIALLIVLLRAELRRGSPRPR